MNLIVTIFCLLIAQPAFLQDSVDVKGTYISEVISFLASDLLRGREAGSEEEEIASTFIVEKFKSIQSCKVKRQKFQFNKNGVRYNSQNVLAFVNNKSDKTILITAHYDHLGMGGELSHSKGLRDIHNGADDNASGVALMLSLAKELSAEKGRYNYFFVAYSGHELGLYGSQYFANNSSRKTKRIALTINFDMVGRLNPEGSLYFDASPSLIQGIESIETRKLHPIKSVTDRLNTLDSKWFAAKNINSATFSTGKHIDYHKVTDDVEYINADGILSIEQFLLNWIKNIVI
ncbi:MAG: Zn-dependent M28 family amino/carboxypeptidase [Crocinitomix sp.]|jgi:Zn-dependent M28 family amino/carboxypeptidase